MAWLYRYKGCSSWFIGWREGRRTKSKTTGTEDRQEAEKQLAAIEAMAAVARAGGPVEAVFRSLTGAAPVVSRTLKEELADWLAEAK
ncbi:MAG: hypothetical protein ACKOET_20185, partial [Verrucomicrobiota bacterium]